MFQLNDWPLSKTPCLREEKSNAKSHDCLKKDEASRNDIAVNCFWKRFECKKSISGQNLLSNSLNIDAMMNMQQNCPLRVLAESF